MYNQLPNLKKLVSFDADLIGLSDEVKITEDGNEISTWDRFLRDSAEAVSPFIDNNSIDTTTDYQKSLAELELVKAEIIKQYLVYSITDALEITTGGNSGQKTKQRVLKTDEANNLIQIYADVAYKHLTGENYMGGSVGVKL